MSGELEKEFAELCHRFFDPPYPDKTPDKISSFFEKLIQENKKVSITKEIRYFIPQLASYHNGKFATMLGPCIEGLSPMHYVPDLNLAPNFPETNETDNQEQKTESGRSSEKVPKEPPNSNRNYFKRNRSARTRKQRDDGPTFRVIHTSRSFQRRGTQTIVSINELNSGYQLTLPRTARTSHSTRAMSVGYSSSRTQKVDRFAFRKQLPPLKENQDNIMSSLYIRDNPNFFTGKMMKPKSTEISIMPPQYPQYLIGNNFEVLSSSGIINVNENKAHVTSLPQFVLDNSNEFIVRQIFKNNNVGKCFFIWKELFREKRFKRIVDNFNKIDVVTRPLFSSLVDKIRERILTSTECLTIFPINFDDSVNDAKFDELHKVSNQSILRMDEVIISVCTTTEKELSDFFREIRSTNLQMQLDFEELHSLNLLPPSLEEYSSDLKWRSQSLSREKERNKLLKKERKIAFDRQNYLSKFFVRARNVYNGTLLMQCQNCMLNFLSRFSKHFTNVPIQKILSDSESKSGKNSNGRERKTSGNKKRRLNKLYAIFDLEDGIVLQPTHAEFSKWIQEVVADIKHAFLLQNKQLSTEIISEIDPEFACQLDNPMVVVERFPFWKEVLDDSLIEIEDSYKFFDAKIRSKKSFMMDLKKQVEFCNAFDDLRNVEQLESVMEGLQNCQHEMSQWPRNIFHKVVVDEEDKRSKKILNKYPEFTSAPSQDEIVDFILEMRLSIEEASKFLRAAMENLKNRAINELNNKLFSEIQEKWAQVHKEESISRDDSKFIESRLILYANISRVLAAACPNALGEVKGSLEVLTSVFNALTTKSNFVHLKSIEQFNSCAEKIGLNGLSIDPDEIQYEEEEEEEDKNNDLSDFFKFNKAKKKRRPRTRKTNKLSFSDNATQTLTEEEEELERKKLLLKDEEEKKKNEKIVNVDQQTQNNTENEN